MCFEQIRKKNLFPFPPKIAHASDQNCLKRPVTINFVVAYGFGMV